jgi:ABC transport system ATP-binding/permease protein
LSTTRRVSVASLLIKEGPASGERLDVNSELVVGRLDADLTIDDEQLSRRHARLTPVEGTLEIEDLGSLNGTWVNGDRIAGPTRLDVGDLVQVGVSVLEVVAVLEVVEEVVPEAVEEVAPRIRDTLVGEPAGFIRPPATFVEPSAPAEAEPPAEPLLPAFETPPIPPLEEPLPEPVLSQPEEAAEPLPPLEPEEPLVAEPVPEPEPLAAEREEAIAAHDLPEPEPSPGTDAEPEPDLVTVLVGQAGALDGQTVVVEDEVVLGREGDVVVDDPEVSRQHALVYREDGEAVIRDLGSLNGTWLKGARITSPVKLGAGDVITLGTTSFEVVLQPAPQSAGD